MQGSKSLGAAAPSWFPPRHPQALKAEVGASCPAATLDLLPPCQWLCRQRIAPGGLLPAPPTYSWALSRGLPASTYLPIAQKLCSRQAQQTRRASASGLQAAEQRAEKPSSIRLSVPCEKRRIAQVSKPLRAAGAKRTLPADSSQPPDGLELSGVASKTPSAVPPKRVARSTSLQSLKKTLIPKAFRGRVPAAIRQGYLTLFIEECLKSCASNQDALEKALQEEKTAYDRSVNTLVYLHVVACTLKKLQGLVPRPGPGLSKTGGGSGAPPEVVLGGRCKTSFSLDRRSSPSVEGPEGAALYQRLRQYLLTEDQLRENGYPFLHPGQLGRAVLFNSVKKLPQDASRRVCCRCGTKYLVSPAGRCVRPEECRYHWGRLRPRQADGVWENRYTCCAAPVGAPGCQVAEQHVQDGRQDNLEGFVQTSAQGLPGDAHPGIYAVDCEMSYTTRGLELTRVTVVDARLRVVYDTFVRPDNEIVDYNTRFSGVTEADLAHSSVSLRDVQAVLLGMFQAGTILIGHSLQCDLLALKLVHGTVVDTSVLFPHHLGLPYKRSLRNLVADYLGQIIQDKVEGHCSSEDASACLRLVLWKVRVDALTKQ